MKMSIASIAVTLVYLVSLVMAADQPSTMMSTDQDMTAGLRGAPSLVVPVGAVVNRVNASGNNVLVTKSNILLSKSDRVQLAQTIKSMLASSPEAGSVAAMTTEDLFGLLTRIATNPAVLANAAGVISAARSGNTGALAGHVVGLLGAALPAAAPTPAPVAAPVPVVAPVAAPMAPSAPMAPAAAPTTVNMGAPAAGMMPAAMIPAAAAMAPAAAAPTSS